MTDEELDAIEQISILGGGLDITTQRTLCAELRAAQVERDKLRSAEHRLSEAYVRLRALIPGAFDTPTAPSSEAGPELKGHPSTMPNNTHSSPLDTQAALQDIRLRIYNRERISPAEMRRLLLDIMRDRESASRLSARSRAAAKKAVSSPSSPSLTIDSLFGKQP